MITEFSVQGMGVASVANEVGIYAVTVVGATGGGAQTPTKFSPFAPAAATTVNTSWGTQPTVGGEIVPVGANSNGGVYRWVARPGSEIYVLGGTVLVPGSQLSIRGKTASSGVITVMMAWMEDPY